MAGVQKIQNQHTWAVPLILPVVAWEVIIETTMAGVADGEPCSTLAAAPAAPAACGEAIDVPLIVLVAVVPVCQAPVMPCPGAITSTQLPRLEDDAKASALVLAATVSAAGTRRAVAA